VPIDVAPVTVIVPCYNEEAGLGPLLARLERMRHDRGAEDWRFLFVDDGSSDRTFAKLLEADSDCTYPPEKLPELTALVADGDAEIATASAWHPESATAEGSWIRIKLSRMVSGIYKLLIGQDVYTFTCLFRAYRRESLQRIRFRSNGFAAVAEIMLRAMLTGLRVREVPMRLEKRRYGESKLKVGDAVVAHLRLLAMTALMVGAQHVRHLTNRQP
jgi:dolichol-phosphate mannosyltransferase